MQKSTLLVGASSRSSYQNLYTPQWGHTWGTQQLWLDPDNNGLYDWYRTDYLGRIAVVGGPLDSSLDIFVRHYGSPYKDSATASGSGDSNITIPLMKGALPHLTAEERDYIAHHLSEYLDIGAEGKPNCAVFYGNDFAYFMFEDPSLPGICNPGGYFIVRTLPTYESHATISSPVAYYENPDLKVNGTLASGTTTLTMTMPWIDTNSSGTTGFYLTTDIMDVGGHLYFGPNSVGSSGVATVVSILGSDRLQITPMDYTFMNGDPILYRDSEIKKTIDVPVPGGSGDYEIAGYTTQSGGKGTELSVGVKGGLETFTVIETFIPIPWAVPTPYSIRNAPYTNIWQRLSNPSIPMNWSTLVYKINGVEVTDQVQITLIPGGAELFYNPPQDFQLNSRVWVYVYVSASPTVTRTFATNTPIDTRYIQIDGDISMFQPGGMLEFGPNPGGESESRELIAIMSTDTIMVEETTYEYLEGDTIQYTYADYPLELNYWFDIVDDFYPPEIFNMYPYNGMTNVDHRHWIRFEIQDEGLGIDISTLTFTVNNLVVIPDIYKYSDNWYQVIYTPPYPFYYNSTVECFVTVADRSSSQNRGYAIWSFQTGESEVPIIMNAHPSCGAFPVHLKDDIQVDVYGRGGGINLSSLVFTVDQKKYIPSTYPKIYRFK
jgi:hypothetical protein